MKKIIIALLIVFLLGGIAVVGVGYYLYRQVRSTASQFTQLAQLPDLERQVRVRSEFTPPASAELTEAQIGRLVRVQTAVRERLGERFAEFKKKYEALASKEKATLSDAPALFAAYGDMVTMWMEAKRSQVVALNEVALSMEEYRWIREQAYRALGVAYVDLDLGKLTEAIRNGASAVEPAQLKGSLGAAGPELNRKLIESVKKQLQENLALASFGL